MAAIYKIVNGDMRIYHCRQPKRNGGEPGLWWLLVLVPLALFRLASIFLVILAVLFVDGVREQLAADIQGGSAFLLVIDVPIAFFLVYVICTQFACLVFSPAKREVYWKFLFFRRHLAWFKELADVRVEKKKGLIFTRHYFVATRLDDEEKKQIRISTMERKTRRLAMFYHYIAPTANDMLRRSRGEGEENMAETVYGEEVEVTADVAENYLGATRVIG